MDGFLNVYKEEGMTSHDVVSKLRKILNTKTIGHTGTLDPNATGVLPVAVGKATKVIEYMEKDDKVYSTELTLGKTTDTEDVWGNVIEERELKDFDLSKENIVKVLRSFEGAQEQIPPMYSAIKIDGKKLYELAREGKTIERQPRQIKIFEINNIEVNGEKIKFVVHCSKGTYIRTLCKDIGEKLGCGAVMSKLERLRSGRFNVETAVTIKKIENSPEKYFINLEVPLEYLEMIKLGDDDSVKYRNGLKIRAEIKDGKYRIYLENGFYGICNVEGGLIKSEKRIV